MGMGIGFGAEAVLPGYTPVRRRETSLNSRRLHRDYEKEWTATRCHRLLRPLTSRIAILNKEHARFPAKRPIHVALPHVEVEQCQDIGSNKWTGDAHWTYTRKRVRYTYSGRGGKSARSNAMLEKQRDSQPRKDLKTLIPGEISVPTPILNRARECAFSNQIVPTNNANFQLGSMPNLVSKNPRSRGETNFQLLRGIRKTTSAARYSIYEGIYNGLETLLKATMLTESEKKRKGCRSLLSACLKTIPAYIAEEEAVVIAHAENSGGRSAIEVRDISTEIYSDLEAFGSLGRGWNRLKVVVRSHAIEVVRKAICAGLLDIQFCGALVTLCLHSGSVEEAECLLSSVLEVGHFSTPKTVQSRFTDDNRHCPLSMLWKFVEDTALSSYQYRQLSTMFSTEQLPLSWLATKDFGNFWIAVIKAVATDSTNADTHSFITAVLPLMARPDLPGSKRKIASLIAEDEVSKALKHTFSSVLATISAIGILDKRNATDPKVNLSREKQANLGRVDSLLRSCVIECRQAQSFTTRYTLLLLANLMVECEDGRLPDSSRDVAECLVGQMKQDGSAGNSATYGDLIQFITLMARCCGRGVSASGFEYLKCIHQVLELLAAEWESNIAGTLYGLMVDSAFLFAEEAPDDEHVEYATHLDSRLCNIRTNTRPNRNSRDVSTKISGFRWEEGISEWVTATPAIKCEKFQTVNYSSEECDTPFRPACRKISDGAVFGEHAVTPRILRSTKPVPTIIPSSDDLLAEGFATPGTRSFVSHGSREFHGQRKHVNRAPRLKRRVLQTSRDWQLFDDSDDELSFAPSQDDHALQDITNIANSSFNSINETTNISQNQCKMANNGSADLDDSEDELCI